MRRFGGHLEHDPLRPFDRLAIPDPVVGRKRLRHHRLDHDALGSLEELTIYVELTGNMTVSPSLQNRPSAFRERLVIDSRGDR